MVVASEDVVGGGPRMQQVCGWGSEGRSVEGDRRQLNDGEARMTDDGLAASATRGRRFEAASSEGRLAETVTCRLVLTPRIDSKDARA